MPRPVRRRLILAAGAAGAAAVGLARAQASVSSPAGAPPGPQAGKADDAAGHWPPVRPGRPLAFPRDHGAHPAYRTEWWYLTGWLEGPDAETLGMQITFFRSRTRHDAGNPSRFAPTQLLFAHAALASPARGRLAHAERAARPGFGLAGFSETDLDVSIGNWRLNREPDDRIVARIDDAALALALDFVPPGPPVPQGEAGFSRKGPDPAQASWYYSRPQLAVSGAIGGPDGKPTRPVRGIAWLDHEWSSEILDPRAAGWDWVGLNLEDGSALMAFRIRHRDGGVLWSDAKWIDAERSDRAAGDPVFTPLREWRSPRTGARWPVAMRLALGGRTLELEPLLDDQEIDATASTGTVYWEGAVRVLEGGQPVGRGYLELTGYAGELRL
ncbi:carotenoid 1,2-hydratase [Burkholderiaceae bacterium FT117]|uniref:lipocalin-like domain-containing protein n=1 Tax=Zeimonas sediminis TaxID=2944268 RepID=UPI0023431D1E|nr:lipocalin-like domain-containing protein [Zeimonas sediminis]MCM5569633.1 carotenoid 1,2-hydratase [Zeimonas sediminis]